MTRPKAERPPPILALLGFDLVFWLIFAGTFGVAAAGAFVVWRLLASSVLTAALGVGPAVLVFLGLLLLQVAVLARLAPTLKAGTHPFPGSAMARAWMWRFLLRRVLFHTWWASLLLGTSGLRFLAIRTLGGRVAFRSSMSSDVSIADPGMLHVDEGALLGSGVLMGGHLIDGGHLILGPVVVGPGAQLHVDVRVGPGCRVGEQARVGVGSMLIKDVEVGAGARLGLRCLVMPRVRIGEEARVGDGCMLGRGAVVQAGVTVPMGTVVPEGAIFPPEVAQKA